MKPQILLFTLLFFQTSSYLFSQTSKPNIIVIISDDQGWGDAGFNGCTDIPTPNLDQLAAEGMSFSAGYASHPYCSPSRAGLLSGRYQQAFGHENNTPYDHADPDAGLPLNERTLPEALKANGYATAAIGKWHLGDDAKFWPNERGFDYWYGFHGGGMSYWGELRGKPASGGVLRNGKPVPQEELTYLTDDFTREAVQFVDQQQQDKPFFMYLAYNAPHGPLHATEDYLARTEHIEDGTRSVYAAMVLGMDDGIGKLITALKKNGQYENTLIFFYSDNGGHINGASSLPFRGHKGMLFEGGIRVPFLVSWPAGLKPASKRYQHPITALDIYPTVLAAADIEAPKNKQLSGTNLLPYLSGSVQGAPHDKLHWRYSDGAGYAIRKGKYKLVYSGYKEQLFLFNLDTDPYEQQNLVDQLPEKVNELKQLHQTWNKTLVPAKWYDPHPQNILKEEKQRQDIRKRAAKRPEKKS